MTNDAQEITIGTVVRLKSGGPLMTVSKFDTWPDEAEVARCEWYDRDQFKSTELRKVALEVPKLIRASDIVLPKSFIGWQIWGWMSKLEVIWFAQGLIAGLLLAALAFLQSTSTG